MGAWSDFFELFPEENPANWIDGRFDPEGAKLHYERKAAFENAERKANAELCKLIKYSKEKIKARSLFVIEGCPQCGLQTLNTYRLSERFFISECQECFIYGTGATHEDALQHIVDALGDGLDWRDCPDSWHIEGEDN